MEKTEPLLETRPKTCTRCGWAAYQLFTLTCLAQYEHASTVSKVKRVCAKCLEVLTIVGVLSDEQRENAMRFPGDPDIEVRKRQ